MKLERVPRRGHTHHVGRTLEWLRGRGFLVQKTEKRALIIRPGMPPGMAMIGPSQDLFGIADLVAVPPPAYQGRRGTWYVQVCARGGGSAHRSKALAAVVDGIPVLPRLELAGCRFLIVNYQLGRTIPKGARKSGRLIWERRVEEYMGPGPGQYVGFDPDNSPVIGSHAVNFFAGFVDWQPADFNLIEGLPKWEKPKAPRASAAPGALKGTKAATS